MTVDLEAAAAAEVAREVALKVSVIVPTYNPGRYLDRCLNSLVSQTLPPHEYEVIFIDDGCTDGTAARLDEVAAQHQQVQVFHQPNSGWPGQPRNRGIDEARGDYVFFCDDDDWLALDALERLHRYATEHGSDIVIGKMAGLGRSVPRELFNRSRPIATLTDAPLMDSLTAHKLFRRSFLDAHGIRFPEGKRRLEDHMFVVQAYLAAEVTSVYADHTCYFHTRRSDGANISSHPTDWSAYYGSLAEVLEYVEVHTEPGPLRDRILSRWLRVEMVSRFTGPALLRRAPADVAAQFDAAHQVARDHFGPGVVARLTVFDRPVARAVIDGDLSAATERAAGVLRWVVRAKVTSAALSRHLLQLEGTVDLVDDSAGGQAGDAMANFAALFPDVRTGELRTLISASRPHLELESSTTGERVSIPARFVGTGLHREFSATLDPTPLATVSATATTWRMSCQQRVLGFTVRGPVTPVAPGEIATPLRLVTSKAVSVSLGIGDSGQLVVRVSGKPVPSRRLTARAWRLLRSKDRVRRLTRAVRRRFS